MIPLWFYLGISTGSPWTWYLTVPALVWVAGFITIDRLRHKQNRVGADSSILISVTESLAQVEHQIWLLRNVFWWYLLPFVISITAFFAQVSWENSGSWLDALGTTSVLVGFVLALYAFVYFLNQYVVRKQFEPRRQELLTLLASLTDDTSGGVHGAYPILMGGEDAACSRRRKFVASLCVLGLLMFGLGMAYLGSTFDQDFPKQSPFAAVRWQEAQPEVEVGGEWYKLVSLDGIATSEIVAFGQRTYGDRWQKRFEEDLVELLALMGHPPHDTVTLVVRLLSSEETRTLDAVPMTKANRRAIRNAAQARESNLQHGAPGIADSEGSDGLDASAFTQALEAIRAANGVPAMAAFVLRGDSILERATVGTCTAKGRTPVGGDAQWHLGSNTKAMTATVAGMLVEEGLLSWDSTIGEILGEFAPNMDLEHRDTTLAMLLQHRSGIAANIHWFDAPEDRLACAAEILSASPESERGEFAYSNAGYVVAGAMMEAVTGRRWEDLMVEKLFEPLGMKNTGFGAPSRPGAPWGHGDGLFGWKPKDPAARNSDNAPVIGPAGTVHATLDDYARFIAAHVRGARGDGGIVSAELFRTLHTPAADGDYSLGWIAVERDWAGGLALSHSGSNTLWFATVWLAPVKDMAFFAVTNAGGGDASAAANEAIEVLIGRHLDLHPARRSRE